MAIVVKRSVTSGEANLKAEMLDLFYPVGSYYETSDTNFDPNTAWGGTWQEDTSGKVLVAKDSGTFATVGNTGGAETHTHEYGIQYGEYYGSFNTSTTGTDAGILSYNSAGSITPSGNGTYQSTASFDVNDGVQSSKTTSTLDVYRMTGNAKYESSLQPYIIVKRWHRTA